MPVGVGGSLLISEHGGVLGMILPGVCYGRSRREVSHPSVWQSGMVHAGVFFLPNEGIRNDKVFGGRSEGKK